MPNTKKPWFQRRHYDFLVNWAATNIKLAAAASLADVLGVDNPSFDRKRFLKTYVELRRFAQRHEELHRSPDDTARALGTTDEDRRRFNEVADMIVEANEVADMIVEAGLKASAPEAPPAVVEAANDILGPKQGEARSPPQAGLVRDRECLSCHHKWVQPVAMSPLTRNLSGEAKAFCPACQSGNVMSLPWRADSGPVIPRVNMDAHIRAHADANRGRGMWEYTSCWKCANGTLPHFCPVACKGACEYPSAVND